MNKNTTLSLNEEVIINLALKEAIKQDLPRRHFAYFRNEIRTRIALIRKMRSTRKIELVSY